MIIASTFQPQPQGKFEDQLKALAIALSIFKKKHMAGIQKFLDENETEAIKADLYGLGYSLRIFDTGLKLLVSFVNKYTNDSISVAFANGEFSEFSVRGEEEQDEDSRWKRMQAVLKLVSAYVKTDSLPIERVSDMRAVIAYKR